MVAGADRACFVFAHSWALELSDPERCELEASFDQVLESARLSS